MGNIIRLRDKQTGEFRDVDDADPEFAQLKTQVMGSGAPRWEQTGDHHVRAALDRAANGQATEEDLGDERPPRPLNGPAAPTQAEVDPWRTLTPGEVEAGLTPDDKEEQLREQFGFDEDDPEAPVPAAALSGAIAEGSDTIAKSASETSAVEGSGRRRRGQGQRSGRGQSTSPSTSGGSSGGSEES